MAVSLKWFLVFFTLCFQTEAASIPSKADCPNSCHCFNGPVEELNFRNYYVTECENNSLQSIPNDLDSNVGFLILRGNSITNISEADLQFADLLILDISSNGISNLPDNVFRGLKSMEILQMGNNRIESIGENVFAGLSKLKEITELHIVSVPNNLFSHTPQLKRLSMTTEDDVISSKVFQNITLGKLKLHLPEVKAIPEDLLDSCSTSITNVHLHCDKITGIPERLFSNLTQLKRLHIIADNLHQLPEHIFHGPVDRVESLVNNRFAALQPKMDEDAYQELIDSSMVVEMKKVENLPKTNQLIEIVIDGVAVIERNLFQFLTNLEIIKIRNFEAIDRNPFMRLTRLNHLELSSGNLTEINAEWFTDLNGLKELNLTGNSLESIKYKDIANLASLQALDIRNNSIKSLESEVINIFSHSVKVLDFSFNKIHQLPDGIFKETFALKEIYFTGNELETFPVTLFSQEDLSNNRFYDMKLDVLDLSHNKIYEFDMDLLHVGSISKLNVRDNLIRNTKLNAIPDEINVEKLDMSLNDINCSCGLLNFINLAKQGEIKSTSNEGMVIRGECAEPVDFKGVSLADVSFPPECVVTTVETTAAATTIEATEALTTTISTTVVTFATSTHKINWKTPWKKRPNSKTKQPRKTTAAKKATTTRKATKPPPPTIITKPVDIDSTTDTDLHKEKVFAKNERNDNDNNVNVQAIAITSGCLGGIALISSIVLGIYKLRGILYKRNYFVRENNNQPAEVIPNRV